MLDGSKYLSYLKVLLIHSLNLFRCDKEHIQRIVVKVSRPNFDFLNKEDYKWFVANSKEASIDYFKGQKPYLKERNVEVFDLIEKGSAISNGELYETIFKIIS